MAQIQKIILAFIPLICASVCLSIRQDNAHNIIAADFAMFDYQNSEENVEDFADPPPHNQSAKLARYIVHHSDWASLATMSTRDPTKGYPFSNVFSISDGANVEKSTGIPYLYLTSMEMSVVDLKVNNKASMSMSLAQGHYCMNKELDPQDPPCGRVILTGTIVTIPDESEEVEIAKNALFERHPAMKDWPEDHGFYFGKMNIEHVTLLAWFGGPVHVPVKDYFDANPVDDDPTKSNKPSVNFWPEF